MAKKAVRVTYVFDVMCGWCHVSRPRVDELFQELAKYPQVECTTLHRRLFTGPHVMMITPGFLAEVRRVGWTVGPKMTGQHFGEELVTLISRPGFSYNSHWSSLACAAVEQVVPDRAFEFSRALQRAFFERGVDVTTPQGCSRVVEESGLPLTKIANEMLSEETLNRAQAAAAAGHALQGRVDARGVPALVAEYGDRAVLLPHYEPQQALSILQNALPRNGVMPMSQ